VLWLTGLPSAGKSTIAGLTAKRLTVEGIPCEVLDGDEVRKAISPTLGFSREERALQALRLAWIAEMLSRHGIVTIVAAVTPFRDDRKAAAALLGCRYTEIWVHADAAVCRARDPKGLWRRCELGETSGVTGFDASYEEPLAAAIKFETEFNAATLCANELIDFVFARVGASLHSR
jgi:adenylylsulfate kinase